MNFQKAKNMYKSSFTCSIYISTYIIPILIPCSSISHVHTHTHNKRCYVLVAAGSYFPTWILLHNHLLIYTYMHVNMKWRYAHLHVGERYMHSCWNQSTAPIQEKARSSIQYTSVLVIYITNGAHLFLLYFMHSLRIPWNGKGVCSAASYNQPSKAVSARIAQAHSIITTH